MRWNEDIKEKGMSEYLEMLNDVREATKGIGGRKS